jgi:hypothetical protein
MNNSKTQKTTSLELRSYTPLQLSRMYEVSKNTFLKWLKPFEKEIGTRNGHYYSIRQVEIIIDKLGFPGRLMSE